MLLLRERPDNISNKKNATTSRSKLKKRLTKIHKKKTSLGIIAIGKDMVVNYSLEKLYLELIRKERRRGDISLSEQVQAGKNQRGNGRKYLPWHFTTCSWSSDPHTKCAAPGRTYNIFQSLSLLGYCLFPLYVGAVICMLKDNVMLW
ncbi:Uncharacterized protein Rs2_29164 [Raphanus sativus]|nr:Uncharacterized protein Rs2_29164 [Raphanus sativus]